MIQEDYYQKKSKYIDAFEQLKELKKYKEETKNQMCGFLVMYELKREQTLKDLSKKLKQTPGYQYENLFKLNFSLNILSISNGNPCRSVFPLNENSTLLLANEPSDKKQPNKNPKS